jgi:hypothetical protein
MQILTNSNRKSDDHLTVSLRRVIPISNEPRHHLKEKVIMAKKKPTESALTNVLEIAIALLQDAENAKDKGMIAVSNRVYLRLQAAVKKATGIIVKKKRKVKKQVGKQAAPTPPLRPLGKDFMVDKNGIIWDHGKAVGTWGVDGPTHSPSITEQRQSGLA